jgi:plasmid stabilization system protein ParE
MSVRYAARALAQLDGIHDYLHERSPSGARAVLASIKRSAGRLQNLPELEIRTDEGDVRLLIDPDYLYRIFYVVRGKDVVVIRILHRAQEG